MKRTFNLGQMVALFCLALLCAGCATEQPVADPAPDQCSTCPPVMQVPADVKGN